MPPSIMVELVALLSVYEVPHSDLGLEFSFSEVCISSKEILGLVSDYAISFNIYSESLLINYHTTSPYII